jgi:PAS domain S-box-containing protein
MTEGAALTGFYDYRLVAFSIFISILAAHAALNLAERVTTEHGKARLTWLCGGASALGIGIWAMHYIGMLAFQLPIPVKYDWPTVLLSLLVAMMASGVALFVVSRPTMGKIHSIIGSIIMGTGIAGMHYLGMAAMRLQAMCVYSPVTVALSVALAVAISYAALELAFASRQDCARWSWRRVQSSLILGLAIPVMHYVGMEAATFYSDPSLQLDMTHALSISRLWIAGISFVALVVLIHVSIVSAIDRRFALKTLQLIQSQLQLQTIFDHMSEGIGVLDLSGRVVHMNKAAARMLDIPDGQLPAAEIKDLFEVFSEAGDLLPAYDLPSTLALRGQFLQNHVIRLSPRSTGQTSFVEVSTAPIPGVNGETQQIIIRYRDITERRRVDETRARLVAIVESSEDAIVGKDLQGIVTAWNRGAERIFGYLAEEIIGQSIRCLLPPGLEEEEEEILARIAKGDTVEHSESIRKRKDGQIIHVSVTISPIKNKRGEVVGASKIARDITGKKLLQRQLHQSQKMEAIGQLTGGIAHDFNNLLAIIIGNLGLLERLVPENEAALKRVQTAEKAAGRGADLTRRLLAFSSTEELNPSTIVLENTIQETVELAERALGPEIRIVTRFDKSVPPVYADGAGLESALLNLAVNARDAMPKGGSLTISTQLRELESSYPPVQTGEIKAGDYACITVSDTGCGMSQETMERAFEPFFTTKPRHKGTGLGLAMVYGFAKQSGGTVRLYSELGYGTAVSLYLPLANKPVMRTTLAAKAIVPLEQGGTVLVVDDEPALLEIATAYLTQMGYTVLQAGDGASALRVLAQNAGIDLLVTDVIMPGGMNGTELAQKVRELSPRTKVMFTSGFPSGALAERSGTLVDGPLLRKPYLRAEFTAMIQSAMEVKAPD